MRTDLSYRYSCDFETNNHEEDCRVWSWGCDEIFGDSYACGEDIDSFFKHVSTLGRKNITLYFHNLKFDGSFILNYLFRVGYAWTDSRQLNPGEFGTLISDMGQWYQIRLLTKSGVMITILDSAKILASDLASVAKSFGHGEEKGSIDYDKNRPRGYNPTEEEKKYQKNDCKIMSTALRYILTSGQVRMTAGSNALSDYRHRLGKKFEKWFPELDDNVDEFCRKAYKGGWAYANPKFAGKVVGKGVVFDVNSLYPYWAKEGLLPYGKPEEFFGKYKEDKSHPLYIQRLRCSFKLKRGKLPTLQLKNNIRFSSTEYLSSSDGKVEELTLSSVDLKLFFDHYKAEDIEWLGGYKFRGAYHMFDDYVNYWTAEKVEASRTGDSARRTLAKLMQNSLIGKFGKRPKGKSKIPYMQDGVLKFKLSDDEEHGKLYIPIGVFVLSYARDFIIRMAQKYKKRFLYSDTDSLHLLGDKIPEDMEIDNAELGKFKMESKFKRAKFLGAKCYCEEEEGGLKVTCAGLPHKLHDKVNFDDFKIGMEINGKLLPKQVVGGVILEKTTFTLKQR